MTVHIDLETCSLVDLPKAGAERYAADPSTQVICLAWAIDAGPVQVWRPGDPDPTPLGHAVGQGDVVCAWNIAFDAAVWNAKLTTLFSGAGAGFPPLHDDQLRCVMAQALYWGLPANLEDAAPALGLAIQKDKAGKALMKRMARPRSLDKATGIATTGIATWWHDTDPQKLQQLLDYCRQDVETERALARAMPPLPADEQELWLLDYRANRAGVQLDRTFIHALRDAAEDAKAGLNRDIVRLTNGQVPSLTSTAKLLAWMQSAGYAEDNLRRNTLSEAMPLARKGSPLREAIRLRLDAARTSTSKLDRMLTCMDPADDRVRGVVQFYGAGRTGRWAGRLIQPQNFPRGSIKNVPDATRAVLDGASVDDLEMLFTDSPMGVVASCLRGTIIPSPGNLLVVADLAQIEARVIAWLAGQWDILDVFRQGQDVYVFTVRKIGGTDRQLGKVLVLACGFGMGPPKFQATAEAPPYRLRLSLPQAEGYVRAWRDANPHIQSLWYEYGDAAIRIARGRHGDVVRCRQGVVFERRKNTMLITLPSGRQLVYRNVGLFRDQFGRDSVEYDGVDQRTRKWTRIRTYGGKLAENVTQAVARDVMAYSLKRMAQAGHQYLLTIHDEAIYEAPAADAPQVLDLLLTFMRDPPPWAPGLPVNAEGHTMDRYRK